MLEQDDVQVLYLIGVFNKLVFCQERKVGGHVKYACDSVDDALVGDL